MEGLNMMQKAARKLDRISLYPQISAGLNIRNQETGKSSGQKSISFSFCISLLRMLIVLASIVLAMKMLLCWVQWKREKKIREKYRAKWRKRRKKMSKS